MLLISIFRINRAVDKMSQMLTCRMDDVSPEVLRSIGGAPNIHNRLTRYTIIPDGGKLIVGQGYAPSTHPPSLSGG